MKEKRDSVIQKQEYRIWSQQTRVYLPSLTLTNCVALDKLPALSEPQEPKLQNGDSTVYLLELCAKDLAQFLEYYGILFYFLSWDSNLCSFLFLFCFGALLAERLRSKNMTKRLLLQVSPWPISMGN